MLEKLIYRNHQNETINFGTDGIFVNMSSIHDHSWNTVQRNSRISSLKRASSKKKLRVIIAAASPAEGVAAVNRIFEVTEKDCLANQHGRIIVGNYYMKCFVTGSEKSNYLITKRYMEITLTIETDLPFWISESTFSFNSVPNASSEFLEYPYDYLYDFYGNMNSNSVVNSNFVPSAFRLTIFGECVNPSITIGGHLYEVNTIVGTGELLQIDSQEKKITLISVDGTKTSKFNSRNRESYIFEPIPSGFNEVSFPENLRFDLTLLEERSEPKWT